MSGLPKGWVKTDIQSVLGVLESGNIIDQGWSPKCEDFPSADETTWGALKTTAIQDGQFEQEHTKQLPAALAPRPHLEVRPGDLLMTCAGPRARCGVICQVGQARRNLFISGKMYRFRPDERVATSRFILGALRSKDLQQAIDGIKTGGSDSGLNLTQDRFKDLVIPLAPRAEQKRIVARLDVLNARSAGARTELARIETLVSRYKQAVLSKAFSGELTKDWRNGRTGLVEWRTLPLDQLVADGPTNGWSPKADGASSGLKSLKLSATSSGKLRLDAETIKYLNQNIAGNSKYWLLPNDILIQRANSLELLGTTVLFDGPPREFIYPDLMMRIRADDAKANPVYLATYLNSDPARSYFRAHATGTAGNMPKINGAVVRGARIPTPPLAEQHEIVRRVEAAFARIDRLAAEAKRALELVGKLDEAILAKAFRGELVPQDDNDEPAEKLLERIRAERAAAPKAKRGRGRKS